MNAIFARMWVMLYNAGIPVQFNADDREVLVRYLAWRVDSLDGAYLTEEDPGLVRLTVSDFAPDWPLTITLDIGGQVAIPRCPVEDCRIC